MARPTSPPPTAWKKYRSDQMVVTELQFEHIVGKETRTGKYTRQKEKNPNARHSQRSAQNQHPDFGTSDLQALSPVHEF